MRSSEMLRRVIMPCRAGTHPHSAPQRASYGVSACWRGLWSGPRGTTSSLLFPSTPASRLRTRPADRSWSLRTEAPEGVRDRTGLVSRSALGPCAPDPGARAVTNGSEEPQVAGLPAQAAGILHVGDSDCGPEGPGWRRRAADRQQPVSVTTGEPARKPWRIMTADSAIDGY